MKYLKKLAPLALVMTLISGAAVAAPGFSINFEKDWDGGMGDVLGYYNGGTAADGSSGTNLGVDFVGVSGLSNSAATPGFAFYANAPSPQGVAYAFTDSVTTMAFMNIAAGVEGGLSFFYSSPTTALAAVKAYSGLNGSGVLLGSLDLVGNDIGDYSNWNRATLAFGGTAQSFDFTGSANLVALDNISAVPEPGTLAMALTAVALAALRTQRRDRLQDEPPRP